MRFAILLLSIILVACLLTVPTLAHDTLSTQLPQVAEADSVKLAQQVPASVEDDEFNLFLLLFGAAMICFMIGGFALAAILFIILLVIFIAFIGLGVISTSAAVGLYKKSYSAGFKAFFLVGGSVVGAIIGLLGFTLIVALFDITTSVNTIRISGAIIGLISGLLIGWVGFILSRKALRWITSKYRALTGKVSPVN